MLMAKDKTKVLIPCYKDLDAYDIPKEFKHLQAQDMSKVGAMQDLLRGIKKILNKEKDSSSSSTFYSLSQETPNFSSRELQAVGLSASTVKSDWQNAVFAVEMALDTRGDYDTVKQKMSEAQSILQELTTTYDDYTYYPKLKDYYSAVDSYVSFFLSPTGSFNQLADTINNYENSIRTYQSDVGFLFNK